MSESNFEPQHKIDNGMKNDIIFQSADEILVICAFSQKVRKGGYCFMISEDTKTYEKSDVA